MDDGTLDDDYLTKKEILRKLNELEDKVEALSKARQDSNDFSGILETTIAAVQKEVQEAEYETLEVKGHGDILLGHVHLPKRARGSPETEPPVDIDALVHAILAVDEEIGLWPIDDYFIDTINVEKFRRGLAAANKYLDRKHRQ